MAAQNLGNSLRHNVFSEISPQPVWATPLAATKQQPGHSATRGANGARRVADPYPDIRALTAQASHAGFLIISAL
jgi:hypothetical protein